MKDGKSLSASSRLNLPFSENQANLKLSILTNEKLLRRLFALKRLHANIALADPSSHRRIFIGSGVGKRQPHGKLEVGLVKFGVHEARRAYDIAVKFDLSKFRII